MGWTLCGEFSIYHLIDFFLFYVMKIIFSIPMKRPRLRGSISQDQTTSKWQSWDSNLNLCDLGTLFSALWKSCVHKPIKAF